MIADMVTPATDIVTDEQFEVMISTIENIVSKTKKMDTDSAMEKVYIDRINAGWQKSREGAIEMGQALIEAKAKLEHGRFESMIEESCPFGARTARRLMQIAGHPVLSNRTHVSDLPDSWGTLAELAKLDTPVLEAAIERGDITPEMTRSDVAKLRPMTSRRRPARRQKTATVVEMKKNTIITMPAAKTQLTRMAKAAHEARYTALAGEMGTALAELEQQLRELRESLPTCRCRGGQP